jgi:hypothetical protein
MNNDYILEWRYLKYKELVPVNRTRLKANLWKADIEIYLNHVSINNTNYLNLLPTDNLQSGSKFKLSNLKEKSYALL